MDLPAYVPLPPSHACLGPVEASWEEIDPGVALIRVHGGTADDRALVHHLLRIELAHHGIEHAQFHFGRPVDEAYWHDESAPKGKWGSLYHGASRWTHSKILREGLIPWDEQSQVGKGHNWTPGLAPRPGHVYLTHDRGQARLLGPEGDVTHNIVYEIDPAYLEPERINPDEDSYHKRRDDFPTRATPPDGKSRGEWAEEAGLGNDPAETQTILEDPETHAMAYRGRIPPEAIRAWHTPMRGEWDSNSAYHQQLTWGTPTPNPAYQPLMSERVAMAYPGDLWHVSPASNRAAIESEGLRAHDRSMPMYNPTGHGQGIRGNYAFDNPHDAEMYAHLMGRASKEPHDIWQIGNSGSLPVEQDPESYIHGYGDEIPHEEAPNPLDFQRGYEMGLGEDEDPDHAPTYYWYRPEPEWWKEDGEGAWEDQDESLEQSGVRPVAWRIPAHVPAHQLTHLKTIRPEDADWQEHWMADYLPESRTDHLAPEPFHRVRWDSPEEYQEAVNAFLRHRQGSRTSNWGDIEQKAKRLILSGQVQILRNSRNVVAAHVIGDHGEYNCEFSRDDPESWTMTQWHCECPWQQYAFQRTRQWKKYEGRPCAHVLASFWACRRLPLDEALAPGDTLPRGHKGFPGQGPDNLGVEQQVFAPQEAAPPPEPAPEPAPAPAPPEAPPGAPAAVPGALGAPDLSVIPPQPVMPGEAMPLPVPGTTPGGMASQPNAVSVPGAKVPTPFNPVQYPGGTYSRTAQAQFENGMKVRLLTDQVGLAEGKSEAHGAGQYRDIPMGTVGEVLSQDAITGWVEVIFPLHKSGPMEPYHLRSFLDAKELQIIAYPPGSPFVQRRGPHTGASARSLES